MLVFNITRNYYDEDDNIFKQSKIKIQPGLTVLVGCNGSGKTTLLKQIKYQCNKKSIPCMLYDHVTKGGSHSISENAFYGNFDFVGTQMISSEGERIVNDLGNIAVKIGQLIKRNPNTKEIVLLLDAIDSGMSVDNVLELKEELFKFVIKDCKEHEIEVYFIVAANGYEMARGEKCFSVVDGFYVKIDSYEDFRDQIIMTRRYKNKRYGHDEFKYK